MIFPIATPGDRCTIVDVPMVKRKRESRPSGIPGPIDQRAHKRLSKARRNPKEGYAEPIVERKRDHAGQAIVEDDREEQQGRDLMGAERASKKSSGGEPPSSLRQDRFRG